MKFCQPHWDKLRAAIDARGLSHLVAQGGEEAVRRQVDQLEQRDVSKSNFDPLMGAHWAIVNNAMNLVGLDLLAVNEDGSDRCPLCFISAEHKAHCTKPDCTIENYDGWIDRASDDMLEEAKKLGLVGST